MFFYLIKYSRLDIANATEELSKANDSANQAAFLEMHHVMKYVLNTRHLELKLESSRNEKEPWDIICFDESNYTGDPVSRRSISGFTWDILGVPVSWQSKA